MHTKWNPGLAGSDHAHTGGALLDSVSNMVQVLHARCGDHCTVWYMATGVHHALQRVVIFSGIPEELWCLSHVYLVTEHRYIPGMLNGPSFMRSLLANLWHDITRNPNACAQPLWQDRLLWEVKWSLLHRDGNPDQIIISTFMNIRTRFRWSVLWLPLRYCCTEIPCWKQLSQAGRDKCNLPELKSEKQNLHKARPAQMNLQILYRQWASVFLFPVWTVA